MRDFSYLSKWEKLLTPEIVTLLTQIHEYKGGQTLFIETKADCDIDIKVESRVTGLPEELIQRLDGANLYYVLL